MILCIQVVTLRPGLNPASLLANHGFIDIRIHESIEISKTKDSIMYVP